jgi:DNA-binding GntR family transcriptional regulator
MLNMVVHMTRDPELIRHEHKAIVEAIEHGQADDAEKAARHHVAGARTFIQKQIAEGKFEPRWVLE